MKSKTKNFSFATLNSYQNKSLREFQQGLFIIPISEHIWLINNPLFYKNCGHIYLVEHSKKSKISLINRFVKKINFDNIKDKFYRFITNSYPAYTIPNQDNLIFLGYKYRSFNHLKELATVFKKIQKKSNFNYVLVIGKGDYELTQEYVQEIPSNIIKIFANNVNIANSKINYIPMGRDFRSSYLFEKIRPQSQKKYLCYCNFSINTHPIRREVYSSIVNKKFIEFDHMGNFLDYKIDRMEFYRKLSSSKFAICPRGNGIDTFRLWDCLYCGTIPIVVKEAAFHNQLRDLPILFINDYSDYTKLTEEFLTQTYTEFLNKKFDYTKLFLSFWLEQVHGSLI